jgi:hypothetical protein
MSGRCVGTVDSVAPGRFSVIADGGEPVWLRDDAIFTVNPGSVRLVCEAHGLADYRAPRIPVT